MKELFTRRSIRQFDLNKVVSNEEVIEIIKAGVCAPSAKNQQPWEFIIIDDATVLHKLANISKNATILSNCSKAIAVIGKNPEEIRTPHMEVQDLAACTQNMLLMATSMGVGSCWIGVYPIEDRMTLAFDILGLKDKLIPFSIIALGYPLSQEEFKEVERYNEVLVHYNRY